MRASAPGVPLEHSAVTVLVAVISTGGFLLLFTYHQARCEVSQLLYTGLGSSPRKKPSIIHLPFPGDFGTCCMMLWDVPVVAQLPRGAGQGLGAGFGCCAQAGCGAELGGILYILQHPSLPHPPPRGWREGNRANPPVSQSWRDAAPLLLPTGSPPSEGWGSQAKGQGVMALFGVLHCTHTSGRRGVMS